MRPWLLRPDCFFSGTIRLFSGRDFVISSKVLTLIERRPGDVGLYLRIGIAWLRFLPYSSVLDLLEDIDPLTGGERHDCFLPAGLRTFDATATTAGRAGLLARLDIQCIDRLHRDVEGLLDGGLDLKLVG